MSRSQRKTNQRKTKPSTAKHTFFRTLSHMQGQSRHASLRHCINCVRTRVHRRAEHNRVRAWGSARSARACPQPVLRAEAALKVQRKLESWGQGATQGAHTRVPADCAWPLKEKHIQNTNYWSFGSLLTKSNLLTKHLAGFQILREFVVLAVLTPHSFTVQRRPTTSALCDMCAGPASTLELDCILGNMTCYAAQAIIESAFMVRPAIKKVRSRRPMGFFSHLPNSKAKPAKP